MEIDIKLKNYNNKSRQGTYAYVKAPGHKGQAYKYNNKPGELELIQEYYKRRHVKKQNIKPSVLRNSIKKLQKKKITIPKSKRKSIKISQIMKQGIGHGFIPNLAKATEKEYDLAKDGALRTFINDKEMRKIMSNTHNFDKLKNRTEYTITAYDKMGKEILTVQLYHKRIEEMKNLVKKNIKKGMLIDNSYNDLRNAGFKNVRGTDGEIVARIGLEITIRKG